MIILITTTNLLAQVNYYIDPVNGNDKYIGSLEKPFKSLTKAKEVVRTINSTMTSNININLRGGNYSLSESLLFENIDGGKNGFKVIYKSFDTEKAVVSGGKQIIGWSQVAGKNFWVADVPISSGFANYFRNIWVDGKRAVQAKSGFITFHAMNYDDFNTPQVRDGFIVKSSELKEYSNLSNIRIFQCGIFKHVEIPLLKIVPLTAKEKALVIKQPNFFDWTNTYTYETPYTLRIINAFEELDEEGEFYLDKSTRKVYYYPRSGESINSSIVMAPVVDGLIKFQGAPLNVVSNIEFEGIRFEYGNLSKLETKEFGRSQADLYADYTAIEGQVTLQYTENITFKKCRFEHFASTGIYLPDNNINTIIEGNVFHDLTATAVLIGKDMNPAASANNNTTIRNNVIRIIGSDFYQASGIYANTSKNLTITNNDVADVAYFGINQRYQNVSTSFVGNTQIKNNRVTNYGTASQFGFGIGDEIAAFYFFGVQNSTVSNNYAQYSGNKNIAGIFRQDQYGLNNSWTNNVADCKTCDRSFSWYNLQTGGVVFNNNFANVNGEFKDLPTAISTNLFIDKNAPKWPSEAQEIIDSAGVQSAYRYLLSEFKPDTYDYSPVPEIKDIEWSNELTEYLKSQRVSFVKSSDYYRRRWVGEYIISTGAVKITSPSYNSTVFFRGAYYGNETIRFNALFNETGIEKQMIAFRAENGTLHYNEQANYHFFITKNTIELIRVNHDGSKTILVGAGGLLKNTVSYSSLLYNSTQLIEISSINQVGGVSIGLKIGGVTVVDVVDNIPGYLTNEGFLLFNAGKLTGTIYISDPELILGSNNNVEFEGILYPNPSDGNIFHLKSDENVIHTDLHDMTGKSYQINLISKYSNDYILRPIDKINSGVYFLKTRSGRGEKIHKIVIQ